MKRILEVCLMLSLVAPALAGTRRDIPKVNSTQIPHDTDGRIHHMEESMYDACVGWWNFDDAGVTQYDASRAELDLGTSGFVWTNDGAGACFGNAACSNLSISASWAVSRKTLSFWITGTNSMPSSSYIADALTGDTIWRCYVDYNGYLRFTQRAVSGDDGGWQTVDWSIENDGRWHHCAVIYDSADPDNDPLFMFDGLTNGYSLNEYGTMTATGYIAQTSAFIGCHGKSASSQYTTPFDEVIPFTNCLTAPQLNEWYWHAAPAKKVVDPNRNHWIYANFFEQFCDTDNKIPGYGKHGVESSMILTGSPNAATTATWSTNGAPLNHYFDFDGSDDVLRSGHLDALDNATEVSLSFWAWRDDFEADARIFEQGDFYGVLSDKGPNSFFNSNVFFRVQDDEEVVNAMIYKTDHCTIATGTWEHIVWTFSNGYSEIYINNVSKTVNESGDRPSYIGVCEDAFEIGGTTGGPYLNGRLDNVIFYDKVLSASEVEWLYETNNPTACQLY